MINASHGAFTGSYSAFHRWRYEHVLKAAGGFTAACADKRYFYLNDEAWPGVFALLLTCDSSGWLTPEQCKLLATDLRKLKPAISQQYAEGHISDIEPVTQKFIDACLTAYELGENLYLNKWDGMTDD